MDFEEFLNQLLRLGFIFYYKCSYSDGDKCFYDKVKNDISIYSKNDDKYIYVEWIIECYEGGTCWGDKAEWVVAQQEKFIDINKIISHFNDSITLKEYNRLVKEFPIVFEEYHEDCYYGNKDVRGRKIINTRELFAFLVRNDII